jgi:cobalt-zinc-cadmium efflux system outer membrane protein
MDSTVSHGKGALRSVFPLLAILTCSLALSVAAAAEEPAPDSPEEPSGVIALKDALAAALSGSPELGAFSAELRAREALTLQAGRRPNPAFRGSVENVGRQGFEDTETTLLLSQLVELGGKRAKREHLAALGEELGRWDYEVKRLDVLTRATKSFVAVLVAQERLALATSLEGVAQKGVETVARSVSAGASPSVETTRARVTLARAEIERARAETSLVSARASLAASWGGEKAYFTKAAGDLTRLPPTPSETRFLESIAQAPEVARWASERKEREASLELEKARGIPDVSVGAGARHFSDNADNALVFEVTVPLPVFDRNEGAVAAAKERIEKARHETAGARIAARQAVHDAYQRLSAATAQANSLSRNALPAARASHAGIVDAFRNGLLRPLDVIESQRTLFELEGEYLGALEAAHLAATELERLTTVSVADDSRGEVR